LQDDDKKYVMIKNSRYRVDFIHRIAHNLSIGHLVVTLRSCDELYSKFLDLINMFTCFKQLELDFEHDGITRETVNKILVDSFFLNLNGRCNSLSLKCNDEMQFDNSSAETLLQLYKSVSEGSTSLHRFFSFALFDEVMLNAFLNTLGIAYRNGRIISNKNIEAYRDSFPSNEGDMNIFYVHIFDGFFHISFLDIGQYLFFQYELIKNLDALNREKNSLMVEGTNRNRMDVYPE
ncbi:hypothetical protein PRIPAC_81076, partial [Pristionchus pacificus]